MSGTEYLVFGILGYVVVGAVVFGLLHERASDAYKTATTELWAMPFVAGVWWPATFAVLVVRAHVLVWRKWRPKKVSVPTATAREKKGEREVCGG